MGAVTIFIQDALTGEVKSQMQIKENQSIPFSFKCELKSLQDKLGCVVAKRWVEGEEKATIILR